MAKSEDPTTRVPKAPGGVPILGHALKFRRGVGEFMLSLRDYGDVAMIRLGPRPVYVVNDPELIRQVLVGNPNTTDKPSMVERARPLIGNGLALSNGSYHRRQRRLVRPALHQERIANYVETMAERTRLLSGSWSQGERPALDQEFRALALGILTRTLFSNSAVTRAVPDLERLTTDVLDGLTKRALSPTPWLAKLPTRSNRRFNAALAQLHALLDRLIGEYRAAAVDGGDMVALLMRARNADSGEMMGDQQVHDEVLFILFAGAETSAYTLGWACHLLATHPDVQAQLQREADHVLGGRPPTVENLGNLAFTRRVLTETLRLHPPAVLIVRGVSNDIELGGHAIPAGSVIMISPYALHRDPALYPQPHRFEPDRWRPERSGTLHPYAFIPFGGGSHGCIGEPFAWTEMTVVLSMLAVRWTFRPVPGSTPRPAGHVIVRPSGLRLTVHPRRSQTTPVPVTQFPPVHVSW